MRRLIGDLLLENRTVVGPGYDRALTRLGEELSLTVHEVPSGDVVWTWQVPDGWDVREAYFEGDGKRFADFREHPLHVWSHSLPFRGRVTRAELLEHVTTDPDRPDAIPYDFRYYERSWGFCLKHAELAELTAQEYDVVIDTIEAPTTLKVGEHVVTGTSSDSIVVMSHLCHPGQANDDLAGVAVAVEAARRLQDMAPRHTLRFLFLPEQIGSIAYLARNEALIPTFKHGIFLEMLGVDQPLALQHSRQEDSLVDHAFALALRALNADFIEGRYLQVIANDEQVLNGPGVDVPTVSLSRAAPPPLGSDAYSVFHRRRPFPQYHSSEDSLDVVDDERLEEAVAVVVRAIEYLDQDAYPRRTFRGTPHLSRFGLWVDWRSDPQLNAQLTALTRMLEGDRSLIEIATALDLPFETARDYVSRLGEAGLVTVSPDAVSE